MRSWPRERLYPRVLPTLDGCRLRGRAHPPQEYPCFTGAVLLRAEPGPAGAILHSLSRDQGRRAAGGFAEKAQAAADTGVQLIVIRRPAETGETADQILTRCREVLNG